MQRDPDAHALLAPGREPFSYEGLGRQTARIAERLGAAGYGPEDRVAVVLPNGPDMAAAFVAIASCAACAPLNPNYTLHDFEFYLADLDASALLVEEAAAGAAVEAARSLAIPILSASKLARAGEFELEIAKPVRPARVRDTARAALLLHTSGTTSRPKLVPLSSANLAASAAHIAATLALTAGDRCLNIMPLFHIHGLMAALLASLHAGGTVVCTDGVYAERFFEWMREFRPTWYTAVPTMHQAILARAAEHADLIRRTPLRLIRSSSASLPAAGMKALEDCFGAPVVEAYGMTEAAHQMTSNPLPPAARKPGSVGPAAGPEVAVLDSEGNLLPPGETGEVAIRGRNVMGGYLSNPEANRAAFTNGWFRTGDQGRLDADGYLHLTGRLKEIINRGGEKISPREIDEVLLAHPAVRQALAFAVTHAQLGEEVAAAVELRPGQSVDEAGLRQWAADRLPAFKVPRIIRIVESIPKGPTGKLQRIGLAGVLGVEPLDDMSLGRFVSPRTPSEERIATIWRRFLPAGRLGVEDRFEALGGDSLLAARMLAAVSEAEGVNIPYHRFVEQGTIAALAEAVDSAGRPTGGAMVALRPTGKMPALFCLPGHDGTFLGLARLADCLGGGMPVFAFDLHRLERAVSVSGLAERCLSEMRRTQPAGPYRLAGLCFGGVVAFEMARLLRAQGESVELLALIDALNPRWREDATLAMRISARVRQMRFKFAHHYRTLREMPRAGVFAWLTGRGRAFLQNHAEQAAARLHWSDRPAVLHRALLFHHRPAPCRVDAILIRVQGRRTDAPNLGWSQTVLGQIELAEVPFHPHGALAEDNVGRVAAILAEKLGRR